MAIQLYALDGVRGVRRCPARFDEAGVAYETEWVDALHSDRNEVKRISGQRGVPVLIDEERGVTMSESANIVEYVERSLA